MSIYELDDDRVYRNELLTVLNEIRNELRRITLTLQLMSGCLSMTPLDYFDILNNLEILTKPISQRKKGTINDESSS